MPHPRSRSVDGTKPLLYFLHINKNAGSTLRHVLKTVYGQRLFEGMVRGRWSADGKAKTCDGRDEDVQALLGELRARQWELDCVVANLPFGVHEHLERPVRYIGFLRDPVERGISYWYAAYRWHQEGITSGNPQGLWSVFERYEFYLRRILFEPAVLQLVNDQTRFFSGTSEVSVTLESQVCAIRHARDEFFFAGTQERFDECVRHLGAKLGWAEVLTARCNVGVKTDESLLPADAAELLLEANQHDQALHAWAVEHVDQQLCSVDAAGRYRS